MNDFLMIGTTVGMLFGLFHAVYMSRLVSDNAGTSSAINWGHTVRLHHRGQRKKMRTNRPDIR